MELVIGRIGKAHGIAGGLTVEPHTDDLDRRFAVGAAVATDPAERGPLTVRAVRSTGSRFVVWFDGVADRTGAEALRGTLLVADSGTSTALEDPEEYWDHQLIGLRALTPDGAALGAVQDVLHPAGGDLLVLRTEDDREVLLPFVAAFVPTVDVAGGCLTVDPPPGLLDLDQG